MTATITEPVRSRGGARIDDGTTTLTQVGTYAEAEHLVDRLSEAGFPGERVRIIGIDLFSVEKIKGRTTIGRAALTTGAKGAWIGLLAGLVLGIVSIGPSWPVMMLGGWLVGLLGGSAFGAVAHWATGSGRDLSSNPTLRAHRYAVQVEPAHAADARHILGLP
jgi:hypothetical protein